MFGLSLAGIIANITAFSISRVLLLKIAGGALAIILAVWGFQSARSAYENNIRKEAIVVEKLRADLAEADARAAKERLITAQKVLSEQSQASQRLSDQLLIARNLEADRQSKIAQLASENDELSTRCRLSPKLVDAIDGGVKKKPAAKKRSTSGGKKPRVPAGPAPIL